MSSSSVKPLPHWTFSTLYKCEYCNTNLNEQNILEHVSRAHCGSYFYKCQFCTSYTGNKLKSLFQHQSDRHNIEIHHIICPLCVKFTTSDEKEIVSHLKNNHFTAKAVNICKYCNFSSESPLDSHFYEKHCSTTCKNCKIFHETALQLFSHFINSHFPDTTLFYCCSDSDCTMMYSSKHSLLQHERDKHGIDEVEDEDEDTETCYYCKLCSFNTYERKSFKKHNQNKHPQVTFHCPIEKCQYESNNCFSFSQHYYDKHLSNNVIYYECYKCEMSFHEYNSLIQHTQAKHNIYQNHCMDCNEWVANIEDHFIDEHESIYLSCQICKKEFEEKEDLIDHLEDYHKLNISNYI